MSKDYGTESEIRQELEKLTTKEVMQKLKLWLNRPTEDIGIINTEQLMLERIEQELVDLQKENNKLKAILYAKRPECIIELENEIYKKLGLGEKDNDK